MHMSKHSYCEEKKLIKKISKLSKYEKIFDQKTKLRDNISPNNKLILEQIVTKKY